MGQFEAIIGVNFWTALAVLLNTLTIFLVGKKFLFGPVMKIIKDRQQEIDELYSDAGNAKAEAELLQQQYRAKLNAAQQTSEDTVRQAIARGQAREEEILRQADAEAAALLEKSRADIAREKKQAIRQAKDELSDMAAAIAEKIVGRELNAADQEKLVDEFINELGDVR